MINIQTIENVADCTPLYLPHSLYLKPLAKMHISVALPINKTGKSISNLEIMDKLSAELKPDKFLVLKVSKSTINCIRFEAELDEHKRLRAAIGRLDGVSLKLSCFNELLRVRCCESKDDFPTRHDWDSYFRDARHMDEMKAGERPDTLHITHLPIRWFCPRHTEHAENVKPSESIFKRIFEKFGCVRYVDIPICDPYRKSMNADINGMRTFSFEQDVLFEAYVQFDEYSGFVRAMDEFRGTKLVRKYVDKTQAINICVTFDKTKHLSDAQVLRRERMRKRLIAKAQAEDAEKEQQKKLEQELLERERQKQEQLKLAELEKQREREEKRKEKHLKKIQERGQVEISQKIRVEERKLIIAQRKLESIRILEQLFNRLQRKENDKHSNSRRHHHHQQQRVEIRDEQRERLVEKYKTATERLLNEQKRIVHDIKSKTPLMGLLKNSKLPSTKNNVASSDDEDVDATRSTHTHKNNNDAQNIKVNEAMVAGGNMNAGGNPLNPFKAVAALAAASGGAVPTAATAAAAYTAEAANEWMKSLSMFPYVPTVFPGMSALYRPPSFPVSVNYRGFAPRIRGMRGFRGRGRGRGGNYDGPSTYYNKHYNNYDDDKYGDDDGGDGGGNGSYYHKSSYSNRGRHRSRTRSYSRSRSRSHSRRRTHSRSRSRSHYHKSTHTSRSKKTSRSRSHSRSRSKSTTQQRTNKKLVSTRRSRSSSDYSRSRSHSRSYRSKRSWTRRGNEKRSERRSRSRSKSRSSSKSRSRSRSRSTSNTRNHRSRDIVLETDKLVRSAEEIQRFVELDTKDRMREEEREIKQNFRRTSAATKLYDDGTALKIPTADAASPKALLRSNDKIINGENNDMRDDDEHSNKSS